MSLRLIMDNKGKENGIRGLTTTMQKVATWWKKEGCENIRVGLFYI